jgi:O-antigen ligase
MVLLGLVQYATVADPARPESFREVSSTFGVGDILAGTSLGQKLHLVGRSSRSIYCNFLLAALPVLFALGLWAPVSRGLRVALLVTVGVGAATMLSGYHFWCLVAVVLALAVRHSPRTLLIGTAVVAAFLVVSPFVAVRNHHANFVEVLDFHETGVLDESAVTDEGYEGGELPTTTEVKKRWIEWQPALNMLRDNPVFGVGTGGYQLHIGGNYGMLPNFEKIEPDTNCGWLVIAASMGLCGFIALVALLYSHYRAAMAQAVGAASAYLRALSITVVLLLALVSAVEALPKAAEAAPAPEPQDAATEPTEAPDGG